MNNILTIGNNFYTSIRCSVQTNDYLLLTDVPCIVSIYNNVYTLEYSESLTGSLFMTSNNGPYMSLQNSLTEVFSNCQLNYNCCLLMIGLNTVAVIKNSEQSFFWCSFQGFAWDAPLIWEMYFAHHWRNWKPCILFEHFLLTNRVRFFWN